MSGRDGPTWEDDWNDHDRNALRESDYILAGRGLSVRGGGGGGGGGCAGALLALLAGCIVVVRAAP